MKVLSLFDGISGAQVALQRSGFQVETYYASEIDKHAIKVTQANFPSTIQLGSVTEINGKYFEGIDLLIGGSPCVGFSFAGKQLNFEDPQSKLFFDYVRILKECRPKYFLLENVNMKQEYLDVITEYIGVDPVFINSNLLSAQNRKRWYWTNIPEITTPEDRNIFLKDILLEGEPWCCSSSGRGENGVERRISSDKKAHCLTKTGYSNRSFSGVIQLNPSNESQGRQPYYGNRVYSSEGKSPALSASSSHQIKIALGDVDLTKSTLKELLDSGTIRKFYRQENERLQTFPDNYTKSISKTQAQKALGNSFTVDVISHILNHIPDIPRYEDLF